MQNGLSLRQFLLAERKRDPTLADIPALMEDIAQATRRIAYLVGGGSSGRARGTQRFPAEQGEDMLEVLSNDMMIEALEWSGHWAGIVSESMTDVVPIPDDARRGGYLCLFDPLDASSNVDVNASIGTIFSILPCPEGVTTPTGAHFLQPGTRQLAAGFVLYGPATVLVLTLGHGVNGFTLDCGAGDYVLTHPDIRVPEETQEFTINMPGPRCWKGPLRRYVEDCLQKASGPREMHFNVRHPGSMVADVFRLLINGGVFLYPDDDEDPDEPGKRGLLFELNPMSFIVEQAGGASTTSAGRTMEIQPTALHQRSPVILGSRKELDRIATYELQG